MADDMIKRIVIKDIATFDKKGVVYDNLQKVNIVYGRNGTGKTTTSRVLEYGYAPRGHRLPNGLTMVKPLKYPTCEVDWEGKPMKVLVYNKDFREQNLQETIKGTFVLGNKNVLKQETEKIKMFSNVAVMVTKKDENEEKVEKEINRIEKELAERIWNDVYKPNKDRKELLKGYHSKEKFVGHIRQLLKEKREGNLIWGMVDEEWQMLSMILAEYVEEAETEISALQTALKEARKNSNQKKKEEQIVADDQVSEIKIQQCADSVNETLRLHGYTGFSIRPKAGKDNEFQIQREDGSCVNDTLSEGEATIISFLYFVKMVMAMDSLENKVVVIDDPISSLDYTAIELVSTLTNELIRKVRKGDEGFAQVIVLTHNTSFHKSLSVNQPRKNTRYWKLTKKKGMTNVNAYGMDNCVGGEYEEMWAMLRDEHEDGESRGLSLVMKRIIETYFMEFGGLGRDTVLPLLKRFNENGKRKNDRKNYQEELKKVFEEMGHSEHYNMMMREE